jgi:hypothetical protein
MQSHRAELAHLRGVRSSAVLVKMKVSMQEAWGWRELLHFQIPSHLVKKEE